MLNEIAYFHNLTNDLQASLLSNQLEHPLIRRFSSTYVMASGDSIDRAFVPLKIIGRYYYFQNPKLSLTAKAAIAKEAIFNWLAIDQVTFKQFLDDVLAQVKENKIATNIALNIQTEFNRLQNLHNFPFFMEAHKRNESLTDKDSKHGLYTALLCRRIKLIIAEGNHQKMNAWLGAFDSWIKDLSNYNLSPFNLTFGNNNPHQLEHHPNNVDIIVNQLIQEGPLKAYRLRISKDGITSLLTLSNYRGNKYSENEFRIFLFIAAYYKLMRLRNATYPKQILMPQVDLCAWLGNQKIFENSKPNAKGQGNDPLWYFTNYVVKDIGPLLSKISFYPKKTHYGIDDRVTKHLILEEVDVDALNPTMQLEANHGLIYFNPKFDDFNDEIVDNKNKPSKKSKNSPKNVINTMIKQIGRLVKNN
jgi:hypothetical protein